MVVSADTDFGALLAQRRTTAPSVVLVRQLLGLDPAQLADRLAAQLPELTNELADGAIVALTPANARIRRLPLR